MKGDEMLLVKCGAAETRWYSLSEAAQMISRDQWGNDTQGLNSESLRRVNRDTINPDNGRRFGQRIGRDIFFRIKDLNAMGYGTREPTDTTYIDIGEIVELIAEDN
jgi:hypothetical protein